MKLSLNRDYKKLAGAALAGLLALSDVGILLANPTPIKTGNVDLTSLKSLNIAIDLTTPPILVRWRKTKATDTPPTEQETDGSPILMTFQYFKGSGLSLPDKTMVLDNTANAQNDMWSDNAIKLTYIKGTTPNSAILLYTSNAAVNAGINGWNDYGDPTDPLNSVDLRSGLIGDFTNTNKPYSANRASVLQTFFKTATKKELVDASGANVTDKTTAITSGPLYLTKEVIDPSIKPTCPDDGPYKNVPDRLTPGFCDYSARFTVDQWNRDPNNLVYFRYLAPVATNPDPVKAKNVFNYMSVVGPYGVNKTEAATGAGSENPTYIPVGVSFRNALTLNTYATIFYLESLFM